MDSIGQLPDAVTLDQLRVFLLVAEQGSFSAAARVRSRAQSAVSYAIANLERILGVPLFDRDGRLPTLTEAGRPPQMEIPLYGIHRADDLPGPAGQWLLEKLEQSAVRADGELGRLSVKCSKAKASRGKA